MEIGINKKTGVFKVGKYLFDPRITYEELEATYPNLKNEQFELAQIDILQSRAYFLPIVDFEGFQLKGRIVFYGKHVSAIYLERISEESTLETFFRENVNWVQKTQEWLKSELGLPNVIEGGVYLEEPDILSSQELSVLKSWRYTFRWGEFGFEYHWELTGLCWNPDLNYQTQG